MGKDPNNADVEKMENYADIFSSIMRNKVTIMRKRCQIIWKFFKINKVVP